MKQLELNVIIEQTKDGYELLANPKDIDDPMLFSWYKRKTYQEVINSFLEGISNPNVKYWYMLQDK
jgi:hypothetical protein